MSSVIGHGVTALSIGAFGEQQRESALLQAGWLAWLVGVAILPDLDYFVDWLHPAAHNGLRVSHSLFGSLCVPALTIAVLLLVRVRGTILAALGAQVVLSGLSHLALDTLVGVTPLPLLWPLSSAVFKLPFGLLPSAGAIELSNRYFYRNLVIEMGVLVPLYIGLHQVKPVKRLNRQRVMVIVVLGLVSAGFMYWAYRLSR